LPYPVTGHLAAPISCSMEDALTTTTTTNTSQILGNAPEDIKRLLSSPHQYFESFKSRNSRFTSNRSSTLPPFGDAICERLRVTEISILEKPDEPSKLEGRIVIETEVSEDMLNGGGHIHGGCSAFLIDMCSSLAITVLSLGTTGKPLPSVSQSLNVVYHSPAGLGETIRLVNTSLTLGARAQSARTEIWNVTKHRLVASGVHIKMQPSPPPKSAL